MFSAASAFALWPSFSARRDLEVPGADIRQHVLTKPHAANHEMLKSLANWLRGIAEPADRQVHARKPRCG